MTFNRLALASAGAGAPDPIPDASPLTLTLPPLPARARAAGRNDVLLVCGGGAPNKSGSSCADGDAAVMSKPTADGDGEVLFAAATLPCAGGGGAGGGAVTALGAPRRCRRCALSRVRSEWPNAANPVIDDDRDDGDNDDPARLLTGLPDSYDRDRLMDDMGSNGPTCDATRPADAVARRMLGECACASSVAAAVAPAPAGAVCSGERGFTAEPSRFALSPPGSDVRRAVADAACGDGVRRSCGVPAEPGFGGV